MCEFAAEDRALLVRAERLSVEEFRVQYALYRCDVIVDILEGARVSRATQSARSGPEKVGFQLVDVSGT